MNIDATILSKTLANQIQEHIKKITYYVQVNFIPKNGSMVQYVKINKCKPPNKQTEKKTSSY